jgi:hypothetical protein
MAYIINCNIARLESCKKMVRKWLEGYNDLNRPFHYRTLFATGLRNQVFGRRMWLFRIAGSLKSSKLSIQAGKKPGFLKSPVARSSIGTKPLCKIHTGACHLRYPRHPGSQLCESLCHGDRRVHGRTGGPSPPPPPSSGSGPPPQRGLSLTRKLISVCFRASPPAYRFISIR